MKQINGYKLVNEELVSFEGSSITRMSAEEEHTFKVLTEIEDYVYVEELYQPNDGIWPQQNF